MSEFVAEIMGVWASAGPGKWVELRHTTLGVQVVIDLTAATLTPAQARRLAEQLVEQASRYESAAKAANAEEAAKAQPPPKPKAA